MKNQSEQDFVKEKNYAAPEVNIITLSKCDIVRTSFEGGTSTDPFVDDQYCFEP